jgi:hypothetical protein
MLLSAPAGAQMMGAQSMTGMGTLQYYVGTWSCMAGQVGEAPQKASATYTMDSGVLREWVDVPPQGKMKNAYVASAAEAYDAKNHRYIETWLGNDADWSISYAKPWTGKTEVWLDHASSAGKLSRSETVRTDQDHFTFTSYSSTTSMKAFFKGSCTRSVSGM